MISPDARNSQEPPVSGGALAAPPWDLGRVALQPTRRPLIMGILNLTPDSFYDGGRHHAVDAALDHARKLLDEGAEVLDLGAESTRPGAAPVSAAQEQDRLLPVLEALRPLTDRPLTVDTYRAETARTALDAGADAINDIAGATDPDMLPAVSAAGCGIILMHMQGRPRTMQDAPAYDDPVDEVRLYLEERARAAEEAGLPAERIMVDPGIGFGKTLEHNLALMRRLKHVADGRPHLLGASRKSFIGHITDAEVDDRLPGSLAALAAAQLGGATLVRVHDVAASRQFLDVLAAINP